MENLIYENNVPLIELLSFKGCYVKLGNIIFLISLNYVN